MRGKIMIHVERLLKEFCELVSIDSVSFHERKMADTLKNKLLELDVEVNEDNAGERYKGNAGNIFGFLKGTIPGPPILFSAHMDTVEPGVGKKAILQEDGRIVSEGTVLGADDVSGIVAILEALRVLKENSIPHRDIEVLFPIAEEVYIKGTNVFDFTKVKAKEGYVLDLSGDVGLAALQAPAIITFEIQVIGKSSHAGFDPESGINAIAIAAEAITGVLQGRIDDDTTVNIGCISGGTATNIVSEKVCIKGEIRSYCQNKASQHIDRIRDRFQQIALKYNAKVVFNFNIDATAYCVEDTEPVVKRFLTVCKELGYESKLTKTFGGSDNNNFLKHGIKGIVLACGMNQVHSTEEYSDVEELVKSTKIVIGLMTSKEV